MVVKLAAGLAGGAAGRGHQGAAAFAEYIGTREGVEAVISEPAADPLVHARYLAERPGSTGLFGADPAVPPDLAAVQAQIGTAAWWHSWVVSMRGPDAEAAGLEGAQDWREMVRRALPQIARAQGLGPGDVAWVGAMHRKVGRDGIAQPHVHVLVWTVTERAAATPARLPRDRLRAVKKVWAREVFGAQRAGLAAEKTAQRDLALAAAKQAAGQDPLEDGLAERLEQLAAAMPGRGRVALAYMPAEVKRQARETAEWLLTRPELAPHAAEVERMAVALAEQRAGAVEGVSAGKRAAADLRDRVAQVLLQIGTPRPPVEVRARPTLEHVAAWTRGEPQNTRYVGRLRRLVGRVVDGSAGEEALRAALGGGPRAVAGTQLLLRRERLRRMRPADAVAARLGAEWPDDAARYQADRLLRDHAHPGALMERLQGLAPGVPEARVRRSVAVEARRAQRQDWQSREPGARAAGLLAAVRRAIEDARAEAEWATTREGEASL